MIESVRTKYDPEKPVIIQQSTGLVVSGRRRLLACKIADVQPETRTVDWDDEKIYDWVMSDELIRRNLTKGQRTSALVKLGKLNKHGGVRNKQVLRGTLDSAKSQQQIANEANTSKSTVRRVLNVKEKDPSLFAKIDEGKLSPKTANECLVLPEEERKEIAQADDPQAEATKRLKPTRKKKTSAPPADDELIEPPETLPAPSAGKLETYFRNDGIPDMPGVYRPRLWKNEAGHEVVIDAFDNPVPSGVGDTFVEPELRQLLLDLTLVGEEYDRLQKVFNELKTARKPHHKFTWADSHTLTAHFDTIRKNVVAILDGIRMATPYAVCPDCSGQRKGCKSCKTTGYWPRVECEVYPDRFRNSGVK